MARNLTELEKELVLLETRRKDHVSQIKNDLDVLGRTLKPGNLLKLAFKDLFSSKTSQGIMGGAAGLAGTLLINGLLRKPAGLSLIAGLLTSQPVVEFLKEDKLGLSKLVDKIKMWINKRAEDEAEKEDEGMFI
jgi:hypothetical protein